MSACCQLPKAISRTRTGLDPEQVRRCFSSARIQISSPALYSRDSSPTCTTAPSSRTTHSSARPVWDCRLRRIPGFTLIRLTVHSALNAYCLKYPQGRWTEATEGCASGIGLVLKELMV